MCNWRILKVCFGFVGVRLMSYRVIFILKLVIVVFVFIRFVVMIIYLLFFVNFFWYVLMFGRFVFCFYCFVIVLRKYGVF